MRDKTTSPACGPLAAQLLEPVRFEAFVNDCTRLVATEIRSRGMTLRAAFSVVQRIKPDILERTVREQMPAFVGELEPCYSEYRTSASRDFGAWLVAHETRVVNAVLRVTDRRAERIASRPIHSAYQRVRGRAAREISDAVPALAVVIDRHVDENRGAGAPVPAAAS